MPVLPLLTSSPICLAISLYLGDIIKITLAKFAPSNIISIIFPIKYIAIVEYNPTSMVLKTNTFTVIIIKSIIKIRLLLLYCGLNSFITYDSKSEPPVEPFSFNITAVPIPTKIPPYIHAKNLSCVRGLNLSSQSTNVASNTVPYIDLKNSPLPILKNAIIKSGIFKMSIVVPNGNLNK